MGGEACCGEKGSKGVDVALLVAVGVALRVGRAGGTGPGIVVGNVGGQTTDCGGATSSLVDLREQGRCGSDVGGPTEPAGVTGVQVHGDVGEVQVGNGVLDAGQVGGLGVGALGDVEVGHQVSKTVGLWNTSQSQFGQIAVS